MSINQITPDDSLKPYKLTFQYRTQYLHVFVAGERDSYEISINYWCDIADECRQSGAKKVLIEEDLIAELSMPDMYRLASELPQLGFYGVRVAFVDLRDEHRQLNQFGETVASNRGLLVKIFNNAAEAENWLLSE